MVRMSTFGGREPLTSCVAVHQHTVIGFSDCQACLFVIMGWTNALNRTPSRIMGIPPFYREAVYYVVKWNQDFHLSACAAIVSTSHALLHDKASIAA